MPNLMNGFTVCVLLYGDYAELHRRCLFSILSNRDPSLVPSIRIGMNAVCEATRAAVYKTCRETTDYEILVYDSEVNRRKYPVMRKMFYDDAHPILTPYLMWFDDDSYITATKDWWLRVEAVMSDSDQIGKLYVQAPTQKQPLGVMRQPWYLPRIGPPRRFKFATGGWWVIRTDIVRRWDYPWPELTHNGGDTTLGEMMRQQGYRLREFSDGVAINADASGKHSAAVRRGVSVKPVWADFDETKTVDLSHHDFELRAKTGGTLQAAKPQLCDLDIEPVRFKG